MNITKVNTIKTYKSNQLHREQLEYKKQLPSLAVGVRVIAQSFVITGRLIQCIFMCLHRCKSLPHFYYFSGLICVPVLIKEIDALLLGTGSCVKHSKLPIEPSEWGVFTSRFNLIFFNDPSYTYTGSFDPINGLFKSQLKTLLKQYS